MSFSVTKTHWKTKTWRTGFLAMMSDRAILETEGRGFEVWDLLGSEEEREAMHELHDVGILISRDETYLGEEEEPCDIDTDMLPPPELPADPVQRL
jgi:hypothetical protein